MRIHAMGLNKNGDNNGDRAGYYVIGSKAILPLLGFISVQDLNPTANRRPFFFLKENYLLGCSPRKLQMCGLCKTKQKKNKKHIRQTVRQNVIKTGNP